MHTSPVETYGPCVCLPGGLFAGMPDGLPSSTRVLDLWDAYDPSGESMSLDGFAAWLRVNAPGEVAAVIARSGWPL